MNIRQYFCPKVAKLARNSHHSIECGCTVRVGVTGLGEFWPVGRLFSLGKFLKLQKKPK
jgi:hypothetical protein